MTYRTIRAKVKARFKQVTGHNCFCGLRITKRNIAYYINEFGEHKPICRYCAKVIRGHLEVI